MKKTVKEVLIDFSLLQHSNQLSDLESIGGDTLTTADIISKIKSEGLKFAGEQKGWMKPFFLKEVISQPKIIKDVDTVVGLALQIGWDKHNSDVADYIVYRWNYSYGGFEFTHTISPAFICIPSKGAYPRKVTEKHFQLSISPFLSHIKPAEDISLFYDKLDKEANGKIGHIKTSDNKIVASISSDGKVIFDSTDITINNIDLAQVEDMWKRGIIDRELTDIEKKDNERLLDYDMCGFNGLED